MQSNKEFFTVATVQNALATLRHHLSFISVHKTIKTVDALGQVLATAPISPIDLPEFVRSAMDGYAVRAADTFGASQTLPAYLSCIGTVEMGKVPEFTLSSGQAAEIHTGAMLPKGADAVVMIERTQLISEAEIEVLAPVAPGENLVQLGEDVARGSTILPAGHRIRPQDIGGLLAVGITKVEVMIPPRISLLSCGDELVTPEETLQPGQIRDVNTYMLAGLFQQAGATVQLLGIARDHMDSLLPVAKKGLSDADMLVLSAGSSVSSRDLTSEVISSLGAPGIIQHGLAIKPGKPTILASCGGKAVIGLPGNPVSAMLVAKAIVLPLIREMLNENPRPIATVRATLTQNIASSTGRLDIVPVRLIEHEDSYTAEPVLGKSNLIYRLVNADGLIDIPLNSGGLKAGTEVEVALI